MTAKDGSGIRSSEDVVCVAEIDNIFNFFENFLEIDAEYRCCKQGGLNKIPECELSIQKSNWFKAFFAVLNVLTIFAAFYSPALLVLLLDCILDIRKEEERQEKEEQQEEKKEQQRQLQQKGYDSIPGEMDETVIGDDINANDEINANLFSVSRSATGIF